MHSSFIYTNFKFALFPFFIINSVHLKIHVPEILKHQIHTKTVFIHHIYKPKKSKLKEEAPKKTYHKETHHEDWSSWNSYGYHNDHKSNDHDIHKEAAHKLKENPFLRHKDSYMPVSQNTEKPDNPKGKHGDMIGYSYPPQYEVHENVKETDHNNIEPYVQSYEEGFHKGGESAQGHIYTGDVTKFYDGKNEEGDHSVEEEYKNESTEKSHAGRYFIDDNEYQHESDKPEKRASFGTFGYREAKKTNVKSKIVPMIKY